MLSGDYWSKIRMSNFDHFWLFYRTDLEKISVEGILRPKKKKNQSQIIVRFQWIDSGQTVL